MSLIKLLLDYKDFLFSLSKKFFANAPLTFFIGVVVFLFNQLFLVLAFFLPLKVIILLGSDGIPSYLSFFVTQDNKPEFISKLAFASILIYVLFIVTGYVQKKCAQYASTIILIKAKKINVFEYQEILSLDVVSRVFRAWGTIFMLSIGMILGFVLEPIVFSFISLTIFLQYMYVSLYWKLAIKPENTSLFKSFSSRFSELLSFFSSIGFFVGFASLFFLIYFEAPINFTVAILLILLIRQLFQRIVIFVQDGIFIHKNRHKIEVLFYTYSHLKTLAPKEESNFDELISGNFKDRVSSLFSKKYSQINNTSWSWVDTGRKGVVLFYCQAEGKIFWMKIYASNQNILIENERKFYSSSDPYLQKHTMNLHSELVVSGLTCFLLSSPILHIIHPFKLKIAINQFKRSLWYCNIGSDVYGMILRTFPTILERLTKDTIFKMRIACKNNQEFDVVSRFASRSESLFKELRLLPFTLVNHDANQFNLRFTESNDIFIINWFRVGVEPLFCDLELKNIEKDDYIEEFLVYANDIGYDRSLNYTDILIGASLSDMDKHISKMRYRAALDILLDLNAKVSL